MDELIGVTTNWPNVYLSVIAWLPQYFAPSLTAFLNSRTGAHKVLFGSNGLPWQRYWDGFDRTKLRDDTLEAVVRENPRRVFGL